MISSIKQRLDREDEGFTLIELMVVVLIIAILLAIAIPTFLGAKNSANARGAQSDLRNALTAEQTVFTNTQSFSNDTTTAATVGMAGLEPSLTWTTGTPATGNVVSVAVGTAASPGSAVALEASGKDNNCYTILQSNDPSNSFTAYSEASGACSAGAAIPATMPTAATINSGSAAKGIGAGWYTSW